MNESRKHHSCNVPFDETTVAKHAIPATQQAALEFRDFQRAFWPLGEDHREVLMLVGASGFSYEEASATVQSARSRAGFLARHELTRLLSEDAPKVSRRTP